MSVWIISNTPELRLAFFLIYFAYFPLMQSMQCSKSAKSNGWRISSFIKSSILPLEIWPNRQCHNFDEISPSFLFLFFVSFVLGTASDASITLIILHWESKYCIGKANKASLVGWRDQHLCYHNE